VNIKDLAHIIAPLLKAIVYSEPNKEAIEKILQGIEKLIKTFWKSQKMETLKIEYKEFLEGLKEEEVPLSYITFIDKLLPGEPEILSVVNLSSEGFLSQLRSYGKKYFIYKDLVLIAINEPGEMLIDAIVQVSLD